MKTFKVIICAMFVLCCGAIFSACNSETKDFNENKIFVGNSEFVYDGESHIVEVDYEGVDVNVTYALNSSKNNFKPLNKLNLVNAGTYKLYYRLSANGYNTYTSDGYLELKIIPREVEVSIFDYNLIKSKEVTDIFVPNTVDRGIPEDYEGILRNENLGLQFVYGEDFDLENLEYGETYTISCTINNPNYSLVIDRTGTLTVVDYVHIENGDGTNSYYSTIQEAINNAEAGDTIYLNDHVTINEGVEVHKSVVIDGQGYSITANQEFTSTEFAGKTLTSMFNVFDSNVSLTLKNVTVDGNKVSRGVSMFHGQLTIDGAVVTNGKKVDRWRSGGVYITNDSSFTMTSGYIGNNDSNDQEYTRYCSDLWIGANAVGSLISITGGRVDNVFVNSNSYSASGAGKFVLDGGTVYNVYVEYDAGYGAIFEYKTGTISTLMVSKASPDGTWGVYDEVTPVEGTTYIGGTDYTVEE